MGCMMVCTNINNIHVRAICVQINEMVNPIYVNFNIMNWTTGRWDEAVHFLSFTKKSVEFTSDSNHSHISYIFQHYCLHAAGHWETSSGREYIHLSHTSLDDYSNITANESTAVNKNAKVIQIYELIRGFAKNLTRVSSIEPQDSIPCRSPAHKSTLTDSTASAPCNWAKWYGWWWQWVELGGCYRTV